MPNVLLRHPRVRPQHLDALDHAGQPVPDSEVPALAEGPHPALGGAEGGPLWPILGDEAPAGGAVRRRAGSTMTMTMTLTIRELV